MCSGQHVFQMLVSLTDFTVAKQIDLNWVLASRGARAWEFSLPITVSSSFIITMSTQRAGHAFHFHPSPFRIKTFFVCMGCLLQCRKTQGGGELPHTGALGEEEEEEETGVWSSGAKDPAANHDFVGKVLGGHLVCLTDCDQPCE